VGTPMMPVMLDLTQMPILVIGQGDALVRRVRQLRDSQATKITVAVTAGDYQGPERVIKRAVTEEDVAQARFVLITEKADPMVVAWAKRHRCLCHAEDQVQASDLLMMNILQQGDLCIAVSTRGKSPAFGQMMIKRLRRLIPALWGERLDEIAGHRKTWRDGQASMAELRQKSAHYMQKQGWFKEEYCDG
jgi:precorrin-2 dehydrogenase/sirohydrochlorin ferrochelatase